jgi:hypothetical protein
MHMEAALARWAEHHGLLIDTDAAPALDHRTDSYAVFDTARAHRFALTRRWAGDGATAAFIMLNPSTATAAANDATLRRCISAARRTGHNALLVLNLFTAISTDPRALVDHPEPAGPIPDDALTVLAPLADTVIAAWGTGHSALHHRATTVAELLVRQRLRPMCLGTNRDGTPKHPVRLPESTPLTPYHLARP